MPQCLFFVASIKSRCDGAFKKKGCQVDDIVLLVNPRSLPIEGMNTPERKFFRAHNFCAVYLLCIRVPVLKVGAGR